MLLLFPAKKTSWRDVSSAIASAVSFGSCDRKKTARHREPCIERVLSLSHVQKLVEASE